MNSLTDDHEIYNYMADRLIDQVLAEELTRLFKRTRNKRGDLYSKRIRDLVYSVAYEQFSPNGDNDDTAETIARIAWKRLWSYLLETCSYYTSSNHLIFKFTNRIVYGYPHNRMRERTNSNE